MPPQRVLNRLPIPLILQKLKVPKFLWGALLPAIIRHPLEHKFSLMLNRPRILPQTQLPTRTLKALAINRLALDRSVRQVKTPPVLRPVPGPIAEARRLVIRVLLLGERVVSVESEGTASRSTVTTVISRVKAPISRPTPVSFPSSALLCGDVHGKQL